MKIDFCRPETVTHKAPKTKRLHTLKSLLTGLKKSIFIPIIS